MLSVVKGLLVAGALILSNIAAAKDVHILVLGDQSAANCNAKSYGAVPGVFILDHDGNERPAADPLDWSDCKGGSIWMPMASYLKRHSDIDRVVLMPVAVVNARAKDWTDGQASLRLQTALAVAKKRGITFDYALWQQGFADEATQGADYYNQMRTAIKSTSVAVAIDKWLIAQTPGCSGKQLDEILEAQAKFAKPTILNHFPGATNAGLATGMQSENCSLNEAGQETMARRWEQAIRQADSSFARSQKETLIYLFR